MSIIICQKHGESGFALRFSKQVVDTIRADIPLYDNNLALFNIQLIDDEDGEELYTETYIFMKVEFEKMGVPPIVSVDKEQEYDMYKEKMPELDGICVECFQEYKKRHNINLLNFY